MRCAFCGGEHFWRLLEYHRPVMKHNPRSAHGIRAERQLPGNGLGQVAEIAFPAEGPHALGPSDGTRSEVVTN
jgi:hypothetical protein